MAKVEKTENQNNINEKLEKKQLRVLTQKRKK